MTKKADFNAEEWSTVTEAPMLAGMRVVVADRGGTIRESLAIGKTYQAARQRQGESELLDELVGSLPAMLSPDQLGSLEQLKQMSQERLREATRLLDEKATAEEVDVYKQFVLTLAETAARAHKEGGFLGIGGKEVSEKEQAVLDELAGELGLDSTGT